jgi:hypothetical protein
MPRRKHLKIRQLYNLISNRVAQDRVNKAGLNHLIESSTIKGVYPSS